MMNMSGHFLRDIPLRALRGKVGDEHVTLLQACYDNPLFDDDDHRDHKLPGGGGGGGGGGGARGSQDGRVPMAKDYMHSLPPSGPQTLPEIRFGEKKRRRPTLRLLVVCLVVVVIIAIIIGLVVHFVSE
jgi:hypothetical protein